MYGDNTTGTELSIFSGNVIFEHDSAFLYCDSAVYNSQTNSLDAYRNVRIKVNDSLNLFSDELNYNGDTKIAVMEKNVRLIDNKTTLTTDTLIYNRNTRIAFYQTGGKIVSEENVLTSIKGYYHTQSKEFYFKKDVVLTNPDYRLESDTLMYNTSTDIAYIFGPTTIQGKDDFIYAESGWYDTKNDISQLTENPYLIYKEQFLYGDSLYYDQSTGTGLVFDNAFLKDTIQNFIITGNFIDYGREAGFAYVTDSAVAIFIDRQDSLFMHADTLRIIFDSLQNPENVLAYNKIKFFKPDFQGMCDSLVYAFSDSTITMYYQPALWTQENQLTAEIIRIYVSGQKIDSMNMTNSSFIISRDDIDSAKFNQIKGKNMTGYFQDNELFKINVDGNSETLYFVREDNGNLIGINKAVSSSMIIRISERNIRTTSYLDEPDATLFPENEYPKQELKLKNFKWLEKERPLNKFDIFRWE